MTRLQKIIAQAGIVSRRKAEELIAQGKVKVNGKVAMLGDKAAFGDDIVVNDRPIIAQETKVYYVLNKPAKTITTLNDPQKRITIIDLVQVPERIFPIGRLDYNTTGVLLLTNDGALAHQLSHPSFEILKVYRARVSAPLTKEELAFLNTQQPLINKQSSQQKVTQVDTKTYVITLHQGSYHHVKKLFELVGKKVLSLMRIEYAGINVLGMTKGTYRKLKPKEIKWLKTLTSKK